MHKLVFAAACLAAVTSFADSPKLFTYQSDVTWSQPFGAQGPSFGFVEGKYGDKHPASFFVKANPKHHSNDDGGSTRQRMALNETCLRALPEAHRILWATVRAAISCQEARNAVFSKLAELSFIQKWSTKPN